MSDALTEFRRKNEAQFNTAIRQVEDIGKEFIILYAEDIIDKTRGFGNQKPGIRADGSTDIRYIPTGQLRGGWYWSTSASTKLTYFEGGPESDYGEEPKAEIAAAVRAGPLPAISYLNNDVAYGYIIKEGLGNHAEPDPWVDIAAKGDNPHRIAEMARRRVMGR